MSFLVHRSLSIRSIPCKRAFSTTPPRPSSLQLEKNDPDAVADAVPAYPYGPARWYKQSNRGLYGGQRIQFGNNVGPKFETKTRRTWGINVFRKRLYSHALNRFVQVRVSARVLRTIDKLGGLDEYLLGEKEARVKELGESGWWLRWAIMQTPVVRKRFAAERERLGLLKGGADEFNEEPKTTEEGEAQMAAKDDGEADSVVLEETEAVGTDGAFEVEQSSSVPPLKFRVGPGAHLVLTAGGWRRTKPDLTRKREAMILRRNEKLRDYVDNRMLKFEEELSALNEQSTNQSESKTPHELNDEEMRELRKRVRRQFNVEMKAMLDRRVAKIKEREVEGQRERNRKARVKRSKATRREMGLPPLVRARKVLT